MIRLSLTLDGNLRAFGSTESVTIGRADSNAFTIADRRVSGHHGEVVFADGCWTYYDRQSTNGSIVARGGSSTVVDGRKTRSMPLEDGDVLLLGDAEDPVRLAVALCAEPVAPPAGDGTIVARRVLDDRSHVLLGRGDGLLPLLRSVGAQTDPESVFDEIGQFLLAQLSGADSIMMVGGGASDVEPTFLLERAPNPPADDPDPPWPRSLVAQAREENVAFLAVLDAPSAGVDSLVRLGVSSAVIAPLHHDQRSLGTLVVLGSSLTAVDLELVSALAFQVASSFAVAGLIRRLRAVERRLREENRFLHERLERDETFTEIIGDSPAILGVFEQMKLVKDTDATVLITGETGTGKELVARALHDKSRRSGHHFAAINCAALTETLLESELFGHVKGAFTGATDHKKGLFVVSDRGSLFLDELGELSLRLQAKLLRVLQEGEVQPVGATRPVKVDVRILAATHRDLRDMVERRAFREDLFYRINVFPIHLPPLRDRGDDLVALALVFTKKYATRFNKRIAGLTEGAAKLLMSHDFPGNIRELENEIQRAVLLTADGESLDARVFSESLQGRSTPSAPPVRIAEGGTLKQTMEALERDVLRRALDERGWNRSRTARELGISRQALMVKLAKYSLVPD